MKRAIRTIIGGVLILAIVGCVPLLKPLQMGDQSQTDGMGTLTLTIGQPVEPQTLVPGFTENVNRYMLSGTGPDGATIAPQQIASGDVVGDLVVGDWTFTVEAQNAVGYELARGTVSTVIESGANEATFELRFLQEDSGDLGVSISFPSSEVDAVTATFDDDAPEELELENVGREASYVAYDVPSGSHVLVLEFFHESILRATVVEAVNIYDNQSTSARIELAEEDLSSPPQDVQNLTIAANAEDHLVLSWDADHVVTETGFVIDRWEIGRAHV